jgi:hypothetical protein
MMHGTCTRLFHGARPGLALVMALALAGCDEPGGDDEVVVEETSSAVASSLDLTTISDSFAAPALLAITPVDLARSRMILDARSALLASVGNAPCVQIESMDTATSAYVEVVYDDCPGGLLWLLEIDGSLRADLAFDTAPCATGTCPTAVRFTLSTDYFRVGSRFGHRFAEIAGSWSLYDPLALGQPTAWDSEFEVSNHLGSSLRMASRASWLVEGGCVNLDFDGELAIDRREDLQVISASAQGVVQCRNECPRAGSVRMAYGRGRILAWDYTGDATVQATGPRGRRFDVALPCGDE